MLPTFNHPRLSGDIVLTESLTSWLPGWIANATWLPENARRKILESMPRFEKGEGGSEKEQKSDWEWSRGRGIGLQSN